FALFEQGVTALGRGGAWVAGANDASAVFFNPAALAGLPHAEIRLEPSAIVFKDTFEGADPYPGYGVSAETRQKFFPMPVAYASRPLSERAVVGLGLSAPFGLETDWTADSTFAGRFLSRRARIEQVVASAALGAALSPRWRAGAAFNVSFSKVV